MKWSFISIILILLNLGVSFSQPVKIAILNKNKSCLPGEFYHCIIELNNTSNTFQFVQLKVDLPENWRHLSIPQSIKVPANSKNLQILSILAPPQTQEGPYTIKLTAIEKGNETTEDQTSLIILPQKKITTQLINFNKNYFAGTQNNCFYEIKSFSNIPIKVLISLNYEETTFKKIISIPTHGIYKGEFSINPPPELNHSQTKTLFLRVELLNSTQRPQIIIERYQLIPTKIEEPDPYFRFPVNLSLLTASTNRYNKRIWIPLLELQGKGHRQHKKELISFHLKGPNRHNKNYLNTESIYNFTYHTKTTKFILGSSSFKATYLTENLRTGTGLYYNRQIKKWNISGFINYPRYYPKIKREYAISSSYHFSKNWYSGISYFSKTTNEDQKIDLSSINGEGRFKKLAKLKWEYAFETTKPDRNAFRGTLSLHIHPFSASANWLQADKDFEGYLKNSRSYNLSLSSNISKNIHFNASTAQSETNMELDTIYSNAPKTENNGLSLIWKLSKTFRLLITYSKTSSKDQLGNLYNYQLNSGLIQLNYSHPNLQLSLTNQIGETENYLIEDGDRSAFSLQDRLHAKINYGPSLYFMANLLYRQDNRYSVSTSKTWQYTLIAHKTISNKLSVNIEANNVYDLEQYYVQRNLMRGNIEAKIGKSGKINLATTYDLLKNSYDKKELQFTVKYTRQLNLPISPNKDNGLLDGQIIVPNNFSPKGIIVYLGTQHTITDKKGHFFFSDLKAGEYFLRINYDILGIHAIARKQGPYPVHIMPGMKSGFVLTIYSDCGVHGKISVSKPSQSIKVVNTEIDLNKIEVSITNGNETFHTQTDSNGNYNFSHLFPGKWTIKIDQNSLPEGVVKQTLEKEIQIQEHEDPPINFNLKRYLRIIKFQESFNNDNLKELSYNQ